MPSIKTRLEWYSLLDIIVKMQEELLAIHTWMSCQFTYKLGTNQEFCYDPVFNWILRLVLQDKRIKAHAAILSFFYVPIISWRANCLFDQWVPFFQYCYDIHNSVQDIWLVVNTRYAHDHRSHTVRWNEMKWGFNVMTKIIITFI